MKLRALSRVHEKIQNAERRIGELETLISSWKGKSDSFWDIECSNNPSSPQCLLFDS